MICSIWESNLGHNPLKEWANTYSQWTRHRCLTVRLIVRSHWSHCYHSLLSSTVHLTNRSQQAHVCEMQLTENSQEGHCCEIISWLHCEVAERLQNELAMRFRVSLLCASCELKILHWGRFSNDWFESFVYGRFAVDLVLNDR